MNRIDLYQLPSEESWFQFALRISLGIALSEKADGFYWEPVSPSSMAMVTCRRIGDRVEEKRWTTAWQEIGRPDFTLDFPLASFLPEIQAFARLTEESRAKGAFEVVAGELSGKVYITIGENVPERFTFDLIEVMGRDKFDVSRAVVQHQEGMAESTMGITPSGQGISYEVPYRSKTIRGSKG